jgi:hypothetical protein
MFFRDVITSTTTAWSIGLTNASDWMGYIFLLGIPTLLYLVAGAWASTLGHK